MRPVNLLPLKHRPRTGGDGSKSAYIALGVLGGLVLAVLMLVMSSNKVASINEEIEQTRQQAQAAEMQTVTLQTFGDFAGIKQSRIEAVKTLATTRLDWERLFRELAHVLPEGVWLTGFDGGSVPDGEVDPDEGPGGPSLKLEGCAATHSSVADVMVRLRALHGADEVELTESAKAPDAAAEEETAPAVPGAGEEDSEGCGPYTSFKMSVTLAPQGGEAAGDDSPAPEVPARLGGGA